MSDIKDFEISVRDVVLKGPQNDAVLSKLRLLPKSKKSFLSDTDSIGFVILVLTVSFVTCQKS